MNSPVLYLKDIHKTYNLVDQDIHVLKGVNLTLPEACCYALLGQSGSGKSTLLHIAGLLDKAYSGHVSLSGVDVSTVSEAKRVALIRENIGFIFQFNNLLPEFTATENVMMPLIIRDTSEREARLKAIQFLQDVGLGHRLNHTPARLSGGEQQRVAIARALITHPKLLLADEPTGNLDSETAETVFSLLLNQARKAGAAVLLVTHNLELAARTDKIIYLKDGRNTSEPDAPVGAGL